MSNPPTTDGLLTQVAECLYVTRSFPGMCVRIVRPNATGIQISSLGPEYVMPIAEANELIGMINRAKHDGAQDAES